MSSKVSQAESPESFFADMKVLICAGSGGVGKTTVAAAMGVKAAREGKKVLVLTIDPSKRLASILGIEGTHEITKVPGQNFPGELYASVIDHQKTFENFVLRASKNSENAKKMLQNKLFQQLSTNLQGSQDFTALEKLYSAYESAEFDLIILDTPPTKHAIDFLNSPQKLSALFNENITRWLRNPPGRGGGNFLTSVFAAGTRKVLQILEALTGSEFVQQLTEFFSIIEKWQSQLFDRTVAVQKLLMSQDTQFCLVSSFDLSKLKESEFFQREIKKSGFHLKYFILNRAFPEKMDLEDLELSPSSEFQSLIAQFKNLKKFYQSRERLYIDFAAKMQSEARMIKIPDYRHQLMGLEDLEKISEKVRL